MTNKELEKENLEINTEEKVVSEEKSTEEILVEDNKEVIKESELDSENIGENLEETIEEALLENNDEVNSEEVMEVEEEEKHNFFHKVLATLVDQIISLGLALLIVVILNFLLPFIGFQIVEKEPVFLIMYVLVNVLYGPICTLTKLKDTIGRRILL